MHNQQMVVDPGFEPGDWRDFFTQNNDVEGFECYGFVLSSGRMAIVTVLYDNVNDFQKEYFFEGVSHDINWAPNIVAENIQNKEDLLTPDLQEIDEIHTACFNRFNRIPGSRFLSLVKSELGM